jgi:hypothetical protein
MTRIFVPAAIALLLSSCGGGNTKTYTDAEGNTVAVTTDGGDDGQVNIETKDGAMVIGGNIAASDVKLPYDLPLMPGATVTSNASANSKDGSSGAMVAMMVKGTPDEVIGFYKKAATEKGFSIEAEMTVNSGKQIAAKKSENEGMMVSATPAEGEDAGKTIVTLIVGNGM